MHAAHRRRWSYPLAAALSLLASACQLPTDVASRPSMAPEAPRFATVPAQGTASTLDIGNWNIEWFGHTGYGPTNETLQAQNVRDVMAGVDMDVWGLQEVVSTAQFQQLVAGLPGYTGVLANDAVVQGGTTYYNDFSNTEQKVALVWKSNLATLVSARVILTSQNSNFAGRPPVEYTLRVTSNGTTEDLVFIVVHCKAGATSDALTLRKAASDALKSHLDTAYPTQKVFVIGDFNDDVDVSITTPQASPYINFVNDAARYTFPTRALSLAGIASTTGYPDFVDHQLATNEAYATYVSGSAQAFRPESYIASYSTTTSDHYPVLSRWKFGGTGTNAAPTAAFTSSCSALTCTFTDGSSDTDGTIASRSWSFGDGQTSTATSPTHTYASAGTYTVTLTVTDNASATGSSSRSVTVTSTAPATPAQVIINEVLANEPGSSAAGEAVEIVNVGGTAISIAGWTLSDGSAVRHTFAAGTMLEPGKAISVYGGASAIPAGIVAVAASTGGLNLANGGDSVILRNGSTTVNQMSYTSSQASSDGVSINRSPDGSATGSWVKHNTIAAAASSIGRRATGVAY